MSKSTPVIVPQENVNDESVTLLSWLVPKGEKVSQGQRIAEVETSKAVMEIEAPSAGVLEYSFEVGCDVEIGGILCYILNEGSSTSKEVVQSVSRGSAPNLPTDEGPSVGSPIQTGVETEQAEKDVATGTSAHDKIRFSKKAKELLEERGLSPDRFAGRGLVRTEDILQELGEASSQPLSSHQLQDGAGIIGKSIQGPTPAIGIPFKTEKLPKSKRTEINYLSSSFYNTLPSVVTVAIPTKGLRAAVEQNLPSNGNATAIIVLFEVARLLRRYPGFNAFYKEGHVNYYEEVNIGFAIDADQGLKVPVIRAANTKSVQEIASEMQELIVSYLDSNLPGPSLFGGTFTVTDLSGEGVLSFHPLLNQGQSAILGVGGEFFPPDSREGYFNLILAFDHQISEGRQAAKFLNELSQHLQAYEKTISLDTTKNNVEKNAEEPYCSRCLNPLGKIQDWDEFQHWDHFMVQISQPNGKNGFLCSVCLRGW